MTRQESQDVCFIRETGYADFLVRTTGVSPQPGDIVDTAGHRVGTHNGLHQYTVGQRRGINCPASQAYYVVRIDTRRNRLVVGFKDELVADQLPGDGTSTGSPVFPTVRCRPTRASDTATRPCPRRCRRLASTAPWSDSISPRLPSRRGRGRCFIGGMRS